MYIDILPHNELQTPKVLKQCYDMNKDTHSNSDNACNLVDLGLAKNNLYNRILMVQIQNHNLSIQRNETTKEKVYFSHSIYLEVN